MAFSRVVLRMLAERRRRSVVAACDTSRKSETPGSTATDTPRSTDDDRHRTRGTRDEGGRQPAGLGGRARLARRAVRRRRGLRRDADHDADDRLSHPHLGRPATGHYQPDTAWCREASTSPPARRHPVPRGLDLGRTATGHAVISLAAGARNPQLAGRSHGRAALSHDDGTLVSPAAARHSTQPATALRRGPHVAA